MRWRSQAWPGTCIVVPCSVNCASKDIRRQHGQEVSIGKHLTVLAGKQQVVAGGPLDHSQRVSPRLSRSLRGHGGAHRSEVCEFAGIGKLFTRSAVRPDPCRHSLLLRKNQTLGETM